MWLRVGHHQEADGLEAEVARDREMLLGDVGLGAMGRDADDRHAEVDGGADVIDGPEPGEHQRGDARPPRRLDCGLHQDPLVGR